MDFTSTLNTKFLLAPRELLGWWWRSQCELCSTLLVTKSVIRLTIIEGDITRSKALSSMSTTKSSKWSRRIIEIWSRLTMSSCQLPPLINHSTGPEDAATAVLIFLLVPNRRTSRAVQTKDYDTTRAEAMGTVASSNDHFIDVLIYCLMFAFSENSLFSLLFPFSSKQ